MSGATQSLDLYGKDLTHDRLKSGYKTHDDYEGQGDTRIVKALMMPVHVRVASPMFPDAEVIQERLLTRGDKVTAEELGLLALEKGERLHAFFTTAELRAGGVRALPAGAVVVSSDQLDGDPAVSELGAHELVDWLSGTNGETPTVQDILDKVGQDADFAKRVIEAEKTRDADNPRKTLLGPLTKVAEGD
jgi:hypothetical protein